MKITISIGNSRMERRWNRITLTLEELRERICTTRRTAETVEQYRKMPKAQQDSIKDVGGFVMGTLRDGRRRKENVVSRSGLTLDMDYAAPETIDHLEMFTSFHCMIYSTHKHTPEKPRLRLIVPLAREVTPDEYIAVARKVAEEIGIEQFDDTTYEPSRLMYWPSTSADGEFVFREITGDLLAPDAVLAKYTNWRNVAEWPVSSRQQTLVQRDAQRQADPLTKTGAVGAFCRTYSIRDAIETFLPSVYKPSAMPGRYDYIPADSQAGVQVLSKTNAQWYEVVLPDGKRGYMSTTFLRYVRTEGSVSEAVNAVVDARQLRDQPFRIYRVVPELSKVTVYARHIFYDLLDNMVKSLRPSPSAVGASVVQGLSSACLSEHGFTFYSDLTSTAQDVSLENVNPVEALLGEGGLAEKYGGELTRDWFDVFLVRRVGADSDVQIREGKNLTGISYDVDETDVVTRIMPTGEDADGNILYLPELYIDSPNIGAYTHPKWIHLAVSEAREVTDGDTPKSKDQCYAELRKAAQTEYENGCDLPTVTLKVDFVNCADTEEYRQYGFLQNIFLGDSVRVVARRIGVEVSLRMTQYTYDCLTQKYTAVTLGTAADTLEGSMISARQLASGSITGMKLALNSVGSGQLQSGSVGSLQIKNAAIRGAHIQDACITRAHIAEALIDTLSVNALTAVTAKIKELAAGSVTTDDLYASVAMIAAAQLTTANIVSADIHWADIEALSARIAQISKAQITAAAIDEANIDWAAITSLTAATAEIVKAQMRTADIDWSHIKDLATDTAVITQGTAGELYIARLAVTEANMVSLTVGELVVKGTDGHFYALSVDENGQVVTTLKQIANDDVADRSIDGGEKIIEGTITAGTLNVQDIFANNAVIKSLIAANLDVDALFAREATVAALNAMDITSNTYLKLMVSGKADKEDLDALNERVSAAELKLTEDAIVAAVTGSDQYKEDLAAIAATGSGPELVVGTQTSYTAAWTGNAGFAALHDGQQITYWLPVTSGSNVTLNLTLADGSATGAIPCYYGGTTRLGTQYAAGNVVRLIYRENVVIYSTSIPKGWWADANYNTDTYDRIRIGTTLKAKSAISAGRLAVGDEEGCFQVANSVPFDVTRPILYCASAVSAGAYGSGFYLSGWAHLGRRAALRSARTGGAQLACEYRGAGGRRVHLQGFALALHPGTHHAGRMAARQDTGPLAQGGNHR